MSDLKGLHAVGYCRVSTKSDTDNELDGQTCETQAREIKNWAERKGVILEAIYKDEGISGATFPRPGISSALMHIQTEHTPILVAYDQSRITRDGAKHMGVISKLIDGIAIIKYTSIDLDLDNIGGKIYASIKNVTDSEERKTLSKRTADGMRTRKDAGIHTGRPARFMFREDVEGAPQGRFKKGVTVTMAKPVVMAYADAGASIRTVARDYLGINPATLYKALENAGLLHEYLERKAKAQGGEI